MHFNEIDPREEKLPKYAQDKLAILRRELAHYKTMAEDLSQTVLSRVDHGIRLERYPEPSINLPRGARVEFDTKDGKGTISVSKDNYGEISVSTVRRLLVRPVSSNVVNVDVSTEY